MKFIAALFKALWLVGIFAIAFLLFLWPRVRLVMFAAVFLFIAIISPNYAIKSVVGAVNQHKG